MTPFTVHHGRAAPIAVDNVDTDQIIPSREMRTTGKTGLGAGLFAGWRYLAPGSREPNPDFVLNQPIFADATILVAGENFGCGSSREHAVWALVDFGVRAVIAKSFGDIFYNNCTRNGVLPIALPGAIVDALFGALGEGGEVRIDLAAQTVECAAAQVSARFQIAPGPKAMLLEGLDPIGLTLKQADEIAAFLVHDRNRRAWAYALPAQES
ncbi:MAG: 3-isopropylmalate dehydratase small subunit [Pseudomonadota bacterium]